MLYSRFSSSLTLSLPCLESFAAPDLVQAWDAQAHVNCRSANAGCRSSSNSLEQEVKLYKTPSSLHEGTYSKHHHAIVQLQAQPVTDVLALVQATPYQIPSSMHESTCLRHHHATMQPARLSSLHAAFLSISVQAQSVYTGWDRLFTWAVLMPSGVQSCDVAVTRQGMLGEARSHLSAMATGLNCTAV